MGFFTIIAIVMVAEIIAYSLEKKLADTLGFTCCGCILILYIFSIFRGLFIIDYISILVVISIIYWIVRNRQAGNIGRHVGTVQNLCILITLLILSMCSLGRVAIWNGDIEYWAVDAKAMWALDGLAGKYGNVASDFGYYPPAISLFKWIFLHISKNTYIEGLGFSAFLCLNYIMLLPLISRVNEIVVRTDIARFDRKSRREPRVAPNSRYYYDERKLISKYKVQLIGDRDVRGEEINPIVMLQEFIINIIANICLILLPSVANILCFEGTGAQVTTGIIYGILLWSIWDKDMAHPDYYHVKMGIYGCVMILCSPIGIGWACVAAGFLLLVYIIRKRNESFDEQTIYASDLRHGLFVLGTWVITSLSWLLICLINHRSSKYNLNRINMMDLDKTVLVGNAKKIFSTYWEGIALHPMHIDSSWTIDMSALVVFIILIYLIVLLGIKQVITRTEKKYLLRFLMSTGILTYAIIFFSQITLFWEEAQNYDGLAMTQFISQYSAPFALGMLVFIYGICVSASNRFDGGRPVADMSVRNNMQEGTIKTTRIMYLWLALLILATCNYHSVAYGLWGYRDNIADSDTIRDEMIDSEELEFSRVVTSSEELQGKRVLYLRDSRENKWERNSYIGYEVSPVSVVYGGISPDTSIEEINRQLEQSHAHFLYVDNIEGLDNLSLICGEQFKCGIVYRIVNNKIVKYYETADVAVE